mgnify:FL=1
MGKSRSHDNIPRRKRMTREQRLQSAKSTGFLSKHMAKDMVRHYARWYGVDLLCAIAELRQLGLEISPEREDAAKISLQNRLEQKRKSQEESFSADISCDSDETFAFIAGYTSGGAPYGVTWGEMEDADGEVK